MKAKAINTGDTAQDNAIVFPNTGFAPCLFLEFLSEFNGRVDSVKMSSENEQSVFIVKFAPSKVVNQACADYINANL